SAWTATLLAHQRSIPAGAARAPPGGSANAGPPVATRPRVSRARSTVGGGTPPLGSPCWSATAPSRMPSSCLRPSLLVGRPADGHLARDGGRHGGDKPCEGRPCTPARHGRADLPCAGPVRMKTVVVLLLALLAQAGGNVCLSTGMRVLGVASPLDGSALGA